METNRLKKFAQETRRKLIEQISAKLEYVLNADSAELREKSEQVKNLRLEITSSSKEAVVDKVAYTWFNRFVALRFLDANDYQPTRTRVLTPKDGFTVPEILEEAKQGIISDELNIDQQRILGFLNGSLKSENPENEAFKELLIGACNHLNKIFPFLFEKIKDYTELLLPEDLLSNLSVVYDIREGMKIEDCQEVEIIGWIYQFYISELNDKLISSKKKYEKNEIAPASQLFTPKWIVEYMVDNTLGQLWSEINPNTRVTSQLKFYIEPAYKEQLPKREYKSIEEIKFFEPCVGSGHILSYAFDVFYKIYEEEGYNPTEIPELIITKNLFGTEIDPRAAQLASFVLTIKGRQKNRRFFRKITAKNILPNIAVFQDFDFDYKFKNASVLGALIKVHPTELKQLKVDENSLFSRGQKELKKLYELLGQRYDVVVTNPPYIGSSRMEGSLKQFVGINYPETKSDLFATFVLRCFELCNTNGLTGFMTPFVWMFISSYQKLREILIEQHFINNLIQLEYSGFDGATVPICTFTLRKQNIENGKGSFIRLSDFKGSKFQAPKTLEAIQNPNCGWFFTANQKDFEKIPGSPIGYWLSDNLNKMFSKYPSMKEIGSSKQGLATTDNNRFCRYWPEIKLIQFDKNGTINSEKKKKWYPLAKGGIYRKWYGNLDWLLNYKNDGKEIKENVLRKYKYLKTPDFVVKNQSFYFKQSISWSDITSGGISFRFYPNGTIITDVGIGFFPFNNDDYFTILGIINSKIYSIFVRLLNPTLHFKGGNFYDLPYCKIQTKSFENYVISNINISKSEWNSRETSWDFEENELIRIKGQDFEESYDLYEQYWKKKFFQLHQNEEELNRQFIEIYGLEDELTPDVPLEEITILKEETNIQNGQLVFNKKEVIKQFLSYAVGCIFGRYSLDKKGLILANQGETLEDYLSLIGRSKDEATFLPDEDNVIPVLDNEWFEDDIVSRFYEFLKASFGKTDFEKNLAFIEECLGKTVRKYFIKDFYTDHVKRYKKRPIYWMFSSPKGSFQVLIYLHRYTEDTLHQILNRYLADFREKIKVRMEHLEHLILKGTSVEQNKAMKEKEALKTVSLELLEYERDVLYGLATERISIDLDDGVLVNYNKFGKAIKEVKGLNDKKTKAKVKKFDWINTEEIR